MNHRIHISISHTKWFEKQKEMAEFLGIKNSSKKSIETRCRVLNFTPEFDEN